MWRELSTERDGNIEEIDYALSFQEVEGCHSIWDAISGIKIYYHHK